MIELRSDNSAAVAPAILAAIAAANDGTALAYGGDDTTAALQQLVRTVFEHPTARVMPVTSGTAANALALSAMTPPWGAVLCHHSAHIITNEAGATSAFSGGAVMHGVGGDDYLIDPSLLADALDRVRWGDNHQSQPAVLSVTCPTDFGTVYPLKQLAAITAVAHDAGMRCHLDGARLANAIVSLGCSPADITWKAGFDAVSLGATKNGAMSAEAIITFDDSIADELVFRTKRAGHVTSKMRYQSAQLQAYLTDRLWLKLAMNSNAQMQRLSKGLITQSSVEIVNRVDANMMFVKATPELSDRLAAGGVAFYTIGEYIRFVTNWSTTVEEIDQVIELSI